MSNDASLMVAAEHLLEALDAPSDRAISISTFYRPGQPLAIKVFISPAFKHLASKVPRQVDGFDVLSEVAPLPSASGF
ncbi:hypothetical protein KC131_25820 [Pseudomonas sp. JQ170]|uniref:hypothetical protein n=1 Tax=unclassified Pseudomonas TaxID=196821 RepID=UPI00264EFB7D|nr:MULTISPECIES: hypothetical protein [unclassified Pseudomonas]MDN7144067.1 hypothetical protein [Pseudomonas sp. JQ170]WRO74214.1 hypothetical protein U9R80_16990 [Pseudomonas sp. 170C]